MKKALKKIKSIMQIGSDFYLFIYLLSQGPLLKGNALYLFQSPF